jgi:hypothetical protein
VTLRFFVSRDADGSVSRLARVEETPDALSGAYFVAGRWQDDGSARHYVLGPSDAVEITEDEAQLVIDEQSTARAVTDVRPTPEAWNNFRVGLRSVLPTDAPELPDEMSEQGTFGDDEWSISFAVNEDDSGRDALDVFAQHRHTAPVHARVDADAVATLHETYRSEFSFDPAADGDRAAADAEMRSHNERVAAQLRRERLD